MQTDEVSDGYRVWGVDGVVYGPVDLPILVNWVKEERVTRETWIYAELNDSWQKAAQVPELKMFFSKANAATAATSAVPSLPIPGAPAEFGITAKSLRRIRIFANFSDDQLAHFLQFLELQPIRQFTLIVKKGDPGDAMYLVLDGEVRVRLLVAGKETILTTLTMGEFFGEFCLFDHGPRSADVVANDDCLLLRISASAFQKVVNSAPELVSPFLIAICRTLTSRIRADNKRFKESVRIARLSQKMAAIPDW